MPKGKHVSKNAAARAEAAAARSGAADNGPSLKWRPGSATEEGSSRGSAAKQRAKDMRKAVEKRSMDRQLAREQPRSTVPKQGGAESSTTTSAPSPTHAAMPRSPAREAIMPGDSAAAGRVRSQQARDRPPEEAPQAVLARDRLPEVMWLEILGHLESAADLCAVEACSTDLCELVRTSAALWAQLHRFTFGFDASEGA